MPVAINFPATLKDHYAQTLDTVRALLGVQAIALFLFGKTSLVWIAGSGISLEATRQWHATRNTSAPSNVVDGWIPNQAGLAYPYVFELSLGKLPEQLNGAICLFNEQAIYFSPLQLGLLDTLGTEISYQLAQELGEEPITNSQPQPSGHFPITTAAFEHHPHMVVGLNAEGVICFFNQTAEKLTGYRATDVIGAKSLFDLLDKEVIKTHLATNVMQAPPDENTAPSQILSALCSEMELEDLEWEITNSDKTTFPARITFIANDHPPEQATLFFLCAVSIKRRKEAERVLQQQAATIYDLYNHAPCGYLSLDKTGNIVRINKTALDWLEYQAEEINGQHFTELIPSEFHPRVNEGFQKLLTQGNLKEVSFNLRRKDGSQFPIRLSATAVKDEEENFIASRSILVDDSERQKSIELQNRYLQSLKQANDRLESQVQERTEELSATITSLVEQIKERRNTEAKLRSLSHKLLQVQEEEKRHIARELHDEMGQTLTSLKLVLEMGAQANNEESRKLVSEAKAMVALLLEQVRELSLDLRPRLLDEFGLVIALNTYFQRYQKQTGIHVSFVASLPPNERPKIEIETAVYRIVQEALTNIARHAEASQVEVRIWNAESNIFAQIQDNGKGFVLETKTSLANSSGLTGMQERATLLGGTVTIKTNPGEGVSILTAIPV